MHLLEHICCMLEVVDEAAGGPEDGHIVRACWNNTATWIYFEKSTNFMIRSRSDVGVIEGISKGKNVGCKN